MPVHSIPLIDLNIDHKKNAEKIASACKDHGFFCIKNHGVSEDLQNQLDHISRDFFANPLSEKMKISMKHGGSAWRGYFAVGDELTSGVPDHKEGLYLGEPLNDKDARVQEKWPLHGANLYPSIPNFRECIEEYILALTTLSHRLMGLISLSLGLKFEYIYDHYTKDPTLLFRIFHYPFDKNVNLDWGVGEHTDYGLLTILKQDDCGGLEVKTKDGWMQVPPQENVFVCNIGDMLELITKGIYRSTPHRVKNESGKSRLSFPFFFDPNFEAKILPLPISSHGYKNEIARWDHQNLHRFSGQYRDYLIEKISKVFPQLINVI